VKRIPIIPALFLLTSFIFIHTQPAKSQSPGFDKLYDVLDGYKHGTVSVVEVLQSGFEGYIFSGIKTDSLSNYNKILLFRTDLNGNIQWTREYGKNGYHYAGGGFRSLVATGDSNFVLAGSVYDSSGLFTRDGFLMKFDANGDTLWMKKYGWAPGTFDRFYHCIRTDDNGFILTGQTKVVFPSQLPGDVYVVKTDSAGNLQWHNTYGGSGDDGGISIEKDHGGGYVISGSGTNSYLPYIVRIDQNGILFNSFVLNQADVSLNGLLVSHDTTYLIYGQKLDTFGIYLNGWLARFDHKYNILWQKEYGDTWTERFYAALEMDDSTIVLAGVKTKILPHQLGWLVKMTMDGDTLWSRYFYTDSIRPNYLFDLQRTSDGGFLMGGLAWGSGADAWLIKVDSMGCIIPGCDSSGTGVVQKFITAGQVHIYPQPFSDHAWAEAILPPQYRQKQSFILLIDILGRQIRQIPLYPDSHGRTRVRINRNGLNSGMYFYRLVAGGEVLSSGKVVVR